MKDFYKITEPYNTGYIKDGIHSIYYEEVGNKEGIPVVYVHGGPGCGAGIMARRFFNPDIFRIIIFDQRGSGRSKPFASLIDNTTKDLVSDMEKIRELLDIDKWIVFGGSWGTTLSLCYAIKYPERVSQLVLRGIFLGRQEDIDWLYVNGASYFQPEAFDEFVSILTEEERKDIIKSYMIHLSSEDKEKAKIYAKRWSTWENNCITLYPSPISTEISDEDITMAMIECHYFNNGSFLEYDNYILDNADVIKDIPTYIVHGRYDIDCRPNGAYELYKKLNNAELIIIEGAGHSSREVFIKDRLIDIMDRIGEKNDKL